MPDNQVHILAEIHGFDFEQLLCLGRGQKSTGDQLVKDGSESQTERYAQNGIRDTQDDSPLDSVYSRPQHQRSKAIHCRLVSVIRTKAQAQSTQRTQK